MVSCAEPLIKRWEQLTASRSSEDGGRGEVQVEFSKQFQTAEGQPLVKDMPVDAMDKGEESQEKITAYKPAPEKH